MVPRVARSSATARVAAVCATLAALAGCGSGVHGALSTGASADPSVRAVSASCRATVLGALGGIVGRVYREGVSSERTATALAFIRRSVPLREALERGDPVAARAAAQALIATGHLTSLRVWRSGPGEPAGPGRTGGRVTRQPLADVGDPAALAPLRGTILGAGGAPVGTFAASVWTDAGFLAESDGIAQSMVVLRERGHNVAGSLALGAGELPAQGTRTVGGVAYAYVSLPASAYPEGRALRIYLFKSLAALAPLCGQEAGATLVNTLTRVARLIYSAEGGQRARVQVRRVQHDQALLQALAARDPLAATAAIEGLLHEHLVRLRVLLPGGAPLADVGGPYVLAPVRAPLRLHGRTIGSLVLSIQDDEGYKRLAGRLAGLDVLMYMGPRLVKNSLGPNPGAVPTQGSFRYGGRAFRVFTLHAQAFPSGPLRIVVLIPLPYSCLPAGALARTSHPVTPTTVVTGATGC